MNLPILRAANHGSSIGEIVRRLKAGFSFGPRSIATLFLPRGSDLECAPMPAEELPVQRPFPVVRLRILIRTLRCEMRVRNARETWTMTEHLPVGEPAGPTPYYGPTREARAVINRTLNLSAEGTELAWGIEIAKPVNFERIMDALADDNLDTEERSALALLLLHAVDRMALKGRVATELLTRIRWHLRRDPQVLGRMRYWWTHMEPSVPVMGALN
jgi:hypothetical protein